MMKGLMSALSKYVPTNWGRGKGVQAAKSTKQGSGVVVKVELDSPKGSSSGRAHRHGDLKYVDPKETCIPEILGEKPLNTNLFMNDYYPIMQTFIRTYIFNAKPPNQIKLDDIKAYLKKHMQYPENKDKLFFEPCSMYGFIELESRTFDQTVTALLTFIKEENAE